MTFSVTVSAESSYRIERWQKCRRLARKLDALSVFQASAAGKKISLLGWNFGYDSISASAPVEKIALRERLRRMLQLR